MNIAIYPGSFDPFTKGHKDILVRACKMYDFVYVVIGKNPQKLGTFPNLIKAIIIKESIKDINNADVLINDGYTVDFAASLGAKTIIKGVRNKIDFINEINQAKFNKNRNPNIETELLFCKDEFKYISSTLVRDRLSKNQNIDDLVESNAIDFIKGYYK